MSKSRGYTQSIASDWFTDLGTLRAARLRGLCVDGVCSQQLYLPRYPIDNRRVSPCIDPVFIKLLNTVPYY